MFAFALLLAAAGLGGDDRAEFDKFWTSYAQTAKEPLPSENFAFSMWLWTQAQFSLGYCSEFVRADQAEQMRRIPDEKELMKTEFGRWVLNSSSDAFRSGMDFRREVRPTARLCAKELQGRADSLKLMPAPAQ